MLRRCGPGRGPGVGLSRSNAASISAGAAGKRAGRSSCDRRPTASAAVQPSSLAQPADQCRMVPSRSRAMHRNSSDPCDPKYSLPPILPRVGHAIPFRERRVQTGRNRLYCGLSRRQIRPQTHMAVERNGPSIRTARHTTASEPRRCQGLCFDQGNVVARRLCDEPWWQQARSCQPPGAAPRHVVRLPSQTGSCRGASKRRTAAIASSAR